MLTGYASGELQPILSRQAVAPARWRAKSAASDYDELSGLGCRRAGTAGAPFKSASWSRGRMPSLARVRSPAVAFRLVGACAGSRRCDRLRRLRTSPWCGNPRVAPTIRRLQIIRSQVAASPVVIAVRIGGMLLIPDQRVFGENPASGVSCDSCFHLINRTRSQGIRLVIASTPIGHRLNSAAPGACRMA